MNRIDFDLGRQTAPRAEWRQTADFHISNDYLAQPLSFLGIDLYQVGRLYCRTSTVVPTHAHINLFELTIITGGDGTVYTNGKRALVVIANWTDLPQQAKITVDEEALGFRPTRFTLPEIRNIQWGGTLDNLKQCEIMGRSGLIILLEQAK